jgi:PAS domain S-box-containing protein
MSPTVVIITLAAALSVALITLLAIWLGRRRLIKRLDSLNDELVSVSSDASVGHRLQTADRDDIGELATTINRLFDALGERDEEIQDKDKLFAEFARTLPEIVLVHDERILLANDSAANLIGLEPDQLEGRDVADLVKPAYRALFRKTMADHLAGESAPRRLEIQLIDGAERGLWVEAQSSLIEYRGNNAILTIARDVSYRKSLEVSLSRSKRQAQYTLESISEGVITTDNQGRIDYMNRAAESMTGANRDNAAGHKLGELFTLIDEADRRPLGDPVERCLSMRRNRRRLSRRERNSRTDAPDELPGDTRCADRPD